MKASFMALSTEHNPDSNADVVEQVFCRMYTLLYTLARRFQAKSWHPLRNRCSYLNSECPL